MVAMPRQILRTFWASVVNSSAARGIAFRDVWLGIFFLILGMRPVAAQQPAPGQETLHRLIESMEQGHTDLDLLEGDDVQYIRARRWDFEKMIQSWGALKSIAYRLMSVHRLLVFDVTFEHVRSTWKITSILPDGRIGGLDFWRLDPDAQRSVKESSCVGAAAIRGTIMWTANVVAVKEFRCLLAYGTDGTRSLAYGGNDWNSALPGGDLEDLKVSINLAFKNPADAGRVRAWTKATVTGRIYRVDEIIHDRVNPMYPWRQGAMHLPSALETEYLIVRDAHVRHVRTGLQAALESAGAIKSMTLRAKNSDGQFVFDVVFEKGTDEFSIRVTGGPSPGLVDAFSYGPHLVDELDEAEVGSQSVIKGSQTLSSGAATTNNFQPRVAP